MLKKFLCMMLIFCLGLSAGSTIYAEENEELAKVIEYNTLNENSKIVYDFIDSINSGNWDDWVSFYTPAVRNYYYNFVHTPNNIANNVGILTVNAANVVSIERIDNCYAPKFNELSNFFETEDSYEVYLVGIDMKVNINTEYFCNGINYKLVVLVNNDGIWQVGGQSGAPIEVLLKSNGMLVDEAITSYSIRVFEGAVVPFGTGYGLLAPTSVPKTIKVANASGTTVYKVNFTDFIKNVTQNEIGNLGFNSNAIKAQAMAAKMCGWWAKVAQYRDSVGADIQYGDVAYVDGTTVKKSVKDACNAISKYKMVSDDNSGNKLFYASYVAGQKDAAGKGKGRLRQNGAEYLATNSSYKYGWEKILHYYYDNSSFNNPSVGIVKIGR